MSPRGENVRNSRRLKHGTPPAPRARVSLFVAGVAVGALLLAAIWLTGTSLNEGEALVVTRGERATSITEPGWHWVPHRWLPGMHARRVSLRFAQRFVTDVWEGSDGTTLVYQVWLELRVVRPEAAVSPDFEPSLKKLVAGAVARVVEGERAQLPQDHRRLNRALKDALQVPAAAAGLEISSALMNLSPVSTTLINGPLVPFARVV